MKKLPKKFFTTKKAEEKPKLSQKSPSISRSITEQKPDVLSSLRLTTLRTHWEVIFVSFISGAFLMGIGVLGINIWKNVKELEARQALREGLAKEESYWQGIVQKYPDYKDAHFQLAIVSYQLGRKDIAQKSIGKVLELDPNAKEALEFAKRLSL